MAKRIAPPRTGKHETQSLLTDGADKDTKYFSADKLAPNKDKPKDLITQKYPLEPKLLGRGAAGANAQAKEIAEYKKPKPTGWEISREAKKLAQKAAPKDLVQSDPKKQPSNLPKDKLDETGRKVYTRREGIQNVGGQSKESQATRARVYPERGATNRRRQVKDEYKKPHLLDTAAYQRDYRDQRRFEDLQGKIGDAREKSDFDNLISAINLNIMNSYTKFRNKKDLDFSAFDKKPEGKKTKLDPKDTPSNVPAGIETGRSQGKELGSDSRGQLRGLRGGRGKKPATGGVIADPSILASRRGGEAKPTKVTNQYKNPKTGLMETEEQTLNLTPSKERKRGKEVKDPSTKKPKDTKSKNPYRQDEKGKYVRGTGYDKKITGSRTQRDETRSEREALPLTRYNRRHEGKLQHGKGFKAEATGDTTRKKERIRGGREEDAMGIETTDPLAPHKHLREQDKEGKIVRNRLSAKDPFADPKNVKWLKGGKKRDPKDAERAVRQGMQNLKGMDISYKGSRMGIKLKGERHSSRGRAGSKTAPLGGEERGKDWFKYWKDHTEKSLDALAIRIKENIDGYTPAKESFGDVRFRGKPAGTMHKKPKNEKQQQENVEGKKLARDQWVKDFATHYIPFNERIENEAKEWQKKKMALLKAFLSPITFKYKWGHTYERGQTKNVETQDHSRTGNTNNNQTYKKDKDDLTIKSLDEIYNSWKNGKKE